MECHLLRTSVGQSHLLPGWFVCFAIMVCGTSNAQVPSSASVERTRAEFGSWASDLNWSDPTRAAVDSILSDRPTASFDEVLLELLTSRDSRVRRNALDAASLMTSSAPVVKQVSVLADRDPDAICQGKARLILAEFASTPPNQLPGSNNSSVPLRDKRAERQQPREMRPATVRDHSESPVRQRIRSVNSEGDSPTHESGDSGVPPLIDDFSLTKIQQVRFREFELPPAPLSGFTSGEDPDSTDFSAGNGDVAEPRVLNRPLGEPDDFFVNTDMNEAWPYHPLEAPLGFTGPSGILPIDSQEDGHFAPQPDRWRSGFSNWDRYGRGHPRGEDYPYKEGHWWDPYNLNLLKGDYPIVGQHTFLRLTGRFDSLQEYRQLPTDTTPFESTARPHQNQFFGDPNQYFTTSFFRLSVELFHGNTSFKPVDWSIRMTPVFDYNYLDVQELGIVNPNVRNGTTRSDSFMALEEYFIEAKLKDLSPDYDFLSMRIGSQQFISDFRGFIFSDTNRAIRLFGTRLANRDQFNVAVFRQAEKDTNSQLNTFEDRNQSIFIANYYRQDFIFPGYTAQMSVHYNRDGPSFKFDRNEFLARPDPVGVFQPHRVESVYFGLAGDGHIGRINFTNAFYWVTGRDSQNPIAGCGQTINAQMAAAEVSYDRDWVRFRGSFFYSSGDRNPYDNSARGFDSILDSPNFAGGQFSYWQRQQINLNGIGLVNRFSLVPDLRSSKFEGQSNFVNPGLRLLNLGADFEMTPKARLITNASYLEFDSTRVLEAFAFQGHINRTIGVDLSIGLEYRPLLNDNIILTGGYACLVPGAGMKDLFGITSPLSTANSSSIQLGVMNSAFAQIALQF